jgi:hypothetical protein
MRIPCIPYKRTSLTHIPPPPYKEIRTSLPLSYQGLNLEESRFSFSIVVTLLRESIFLAPPMSFFFTKWFMKRKNKFLGGLTEWGEHALFNSFSS